MPANSPMCVPTADQRVVTRSLSAIWSSIDTPSSPKASCSTRTAAKYPARSIVAPAGSCPTNPGATSRSSTSSRRPAARPRSSAGRRAWAGRRATCGQPGGGARPSVDAERARAAATTLLQGSDLGRQRSLRSACSSSRRTSRRLRAQEPRGRDPGLGLAAVEPEAQGQHPPLARVERCPAARRARRRRSRRAAPGRGRDQRAELDLARRRPARRARPRRGARRARPRPPRPSSRGAVPPPRARARARACAASLSSARSR